MARRRYYKSQESRLWGRRFPKRLPSKYLSRFLFDDWPFAGPVPGSGVRVFVKQARLREEREAWRIELLNETDDDNSLP